MPIRSCLGAVARMSESICFLLVPPNLVELICFDVLRVIPGKTW